MLKISRESEINLVNVLIDNDIISGKDLIDIKKISTENNKSQIDAIFELKLTDEQKIIDFIKSKAKKTVIEIDKSEAEKILKEENEKNLKAQSTADVTEKKPKTSEKKPKKAPIKKKAKKVSKK